MIKTVLVTGAAGGLGMALALRYHADGWNVIAADRNDLSMAELLKFTGIRPVRMDVTTDDSVMQVAEELRLEGTQIGLIINNAGIDDYFPLSADPARFRRVIDVNVFGATRVNSIFLPLLERPGGRIIHIGSESFRLTMPFMPYPLSKRLLDSYSHALRVELGLIGIAVSIVRPGAVDTPLLKVIGELHGKVPDGWLSAWFERFAQKAGKRVGRRWSPERAAGFIYRISVRKKLKSSYSFNNMIGLRLLALVPFPLQEFMVRRMLSR